MIYLDASVVFSLYCADANTSLAISLVGAAHTPLLLSSLCEFEVVNAFSLAVFRGEMTELLAMGARRKLESNLASGAFLGRGLPESSFSRAKALAERITPAIGVRAIDLLHIAAGLELGANFLYTFDHRQGRAALAAGLAVNAVPVDPI